MATFNSPRTRGIFPEEDLQVLDMLPIIRYKCVVSAMCVYVFFVSIYIYTNFPGKVCPSYEYIAYERDCI